MSKRNRKFTLDSAPATTAPQKAAKSMTTTQVVLLSIGIVTLFLISLLTTSDLFWGSGTDIHTYQYPHRAFIANALKDGHWPLWNPYIFSGVPFQTGVHPLSYPLAWLGLFFSTGWEIKITIWIHLVIALTFSVLFLRLFNIKAVPAFLGGISFALSGFCFSHLYAGHIDIITSYAYLPVMMYFLEKALRSQTFKWTLIAGLMMTLTLFTGHYQINYMTILLMGFLCLFRTILGSNLVIKPLTFKQLTDDKPEWRQLPDDGFPSGKDAPDLLADDVDWKSRIFEALYSLERLVVIGIISGLLALFQLLPMLQSSSMANRSVVKDLEFATSFGTPNLNMLTYLAPDIFGGTEKMPFFAPWSGWEGQGYFGIITLMLVIIALSLLPWKKQLPIIIVMAIALCLAMGEYAPFFKLYYYIDPVIGRFRVPSRFVMLVAFLGSWLGVLSLNSYINASKIKLAQNKTGFVITAVTLLVLMLGFIFFLHQNSTTQAGLQFVKSVTSPRVLSYMRGSEGNVLYYMNSRLFISAGLMLLSIFVLMVGFSKPQWRNYLAIILLIATGLDLMYYAAPKLTTAPASKFGFNDALTNYLHNANKNQQRIMTSPGLRGVNNGAAYGLAHDGGYDTLIEARYNEYANLAMGYEKDRQLMLMTLFSYGPFWQNQAVAWFLSDTPIEKLPARTADKFAPYFKLDKKIGKVYVYNNPDVLDRAFVTHQVKQFNNSEKLYSYLTKNRLTPDQVYWSEEDGEKIPQELASLQKPTSDIKEEVKIAALTPNRVDINADLAKDGLVVMTDTPFPGWHAEVDGQAANLYSINGGLHRATLVPAGKHQVTFYYWPKTLTIGLIISLLSFLAAIAYLIFLNLKSRQKI